MDKRGQTTLFIILGIIIVVIAVIVISVYKPELISPRLSEGQLQPIKNYVENCMQEILEQSLFLLKENAGHYGRVGQENIYGFSYLTPNTYNANDVLERQISDDVKYKLENECSLDIFDQYEIQTGNIDVETEIGWHESVVNVFYPIKISKEGIILELSEFSISKKDEFGLMNAVAGKIVNKEDYDQNSIFKGEEFTVYGPNIESAGRVFKIYTPYSGANIYGFII